MSRDDVDRLLGRRDEPLEKDRDLFETVEEVFDMATVASILELMRKKIIRRISGVISAGKEARVYLARGFGDEYLALKIYYTSTAEFKKGIYKYIRGDPRFTGLKARSTRDLIYAWARKEYGNLKRMWDAGVRVPRPIAFKNNVVVMEFMGVEGVRYPLLIEAYRDLEAADLESIYHQVITELVKIYCKARLVHGDLSEYNIMVTPDLRVVVIDVGQAVDLSHPNAEDLLARDIRNINRFFSSEAGLKTLSFEETLGVVKECRGIEKEDFFQV
ncbi:MAG: serine protein kinase RIO [Desulfurococcus sp.]|nr:serine protein kinase RIO [Desulfurococcus sp.]